jgi:hypothetical protein
MRLLQLVYIQADFDQQTDHSPPSRVAQTLHESYRYTVNIDWKPFQFSTGMTYLAECHVLMGASKFNVDTGTA